VSLNGIQDSEMTVFGLSKDCEVMVMGEMASFDVELIEHIVMADSVSPNLLNDWVLKLAFEDMVMVRLFGDMAPMIINVSIDLNFNVWHFIC
jgi:hypothetical protein